MILKFSKGIMFSDIILFSVSPSRLLCVASPSTNFIFMPVSDLGGLKTFSDAERFALADTERIVSDLKDMVAVKNYIESEMLKLGFRLVGELSINDYLEEFKRFFK